MKKKNFRIVRYYLNGEVQLGQKISVKQSMYFTDYLEKIVHNEAGGLTYWYRIDIQPK